MEVKLFLKNADLENSASIEEADFLPSMEWGKGLKYRACRKHRCLDTDLSVKEPLSNRIRALLRQQLLDGQLSPGTRIDYKQLAKQLDVSTTPIREAAVHLASEGLLELIPRLGAIVPSLNPASARNLYEVREAVEPYAAAKAAERIHKRNLEVMLEALHTMEKIRDEQIIGKKSSVQGPCEATSRFLAADMEFHRLILHAAGNPILARTAEESHLQFRIFFRHQGIYDHDGLETVCSQHRTIYVALERGDGEAAAQAMKLHLNTFLNVALGQLEALPHTPGYSGF